MAKHNPLRIELHHELGGSDRKMVFSIGSIMETEEIIGRPLTSELFKFAETRGFFRMDLLVGLVCGGIRQAKGNKAVTPERVAEMLPLDFAEKVELLGKVAQAAMKVLGIGVEMPAEDGEAASEGKDPGRSAGHLPDLTDASTLIES